MKAFETGKKLSVYKNYTFFICVCIMWVNVAFEINNSNLSFFSNMISTTEQSMFDLEECQLTKDPGMRSSMPTSGRYTPSSNTCEPCTGFQQDV